MPLLALLWMFAGPFWLEKAPADWTDLELSQFFVDSPWAQTLGGASRAVVAPPVQVYIATAPLMREAENERERRAKLRRKPGAPEAEDPLAEEYRLWLEDNAASQVVLAIRMRSNPKLSEQGEIRHMEQDSFFEVGRKRVKLTGHFPPTPSDPYLRLAFPRQALGEEKTVTFSFYAPGLAGPYREAQFKLKDLIVDGKPQL